MTETKQTYCGYIALIGRPNVGKSTLLNLLIGSKVSITSSKPQTTRNRLLGIKTEGLYQTIYVDTPGIHANREQKALNKAMNRISSYTINDVDAVVLLLDLTKHTKDDDLVIEKCRDLEVPLIVVLNKLDQVKNKNTLLPLIERLETQISPKAIVPLSAKTGDNVEQLESLIHDLLQPSPHFFGSDNITDKNDRFLVAEIVREKIFRMTGEELPYSTAVQLEQYEKKGKVMHIAALIYVEREGQKKIIIGKGGEKLKQIGQKARLDIEKLIGRKVFLQCWIKVRSGWSDDDIALRTLGYHDLD